MKIRWRTTKNTHDKPHDDEEEHGDGEDTACCSTDDGTNIDAAGGAGWRVRGRDGSACVVRGSGLAECVESILSPSVIGGGSSTFGLSRSQGPKFE